MIDRRHFLGSAAATAAFFAMHDSPLLGAQLPAAAALQMDTKVPRILGLELLSGAPMAAMKEFYGKTLDLRLLDERNDRFTVEAGESRITFVSSADKVDGRPPFYHVAFNIPENKIVKALEWQKARSPILAIPERRRAAGFPPEVIDYSHWNAHSVFFLDPAGNVLEYIARHDLKNPDNAPFGWSDILYVSEIALVVDDVPAMAETLKGVASVAQYRNGDAEFMAMGDEYGLVLIMRRGRVIDFTEKPENGVRVYRTGITLRGAAAAKHQLAGHPYVLTIEQRCSCG